MGVLEAAPATRFLEGFRKTDKALGGIVRLGIWLEEIAQEGYER